MAKPVPLIDRRIAVVSVALTRAERVRLRTMAKAAKHTTSDHIRMLVIADWERFEAERLERESDDIWEAGE